MDEDDEREEAAANLATQITDAAQELVDDYGYTEEDILGILKGTVFG